MLEDLFIKLVSISSPSGNESEVASFVKNEFELCGFETALDKEGNLFARSPKAKGEPVLLSAHLDTVQGGSCVKPILKNKIFKSSGDTILGADNKAAMAAIIMALKQTCKSKRKNLELVFSVREETDGGVSNLNLSWLKSKIGISADSGEPIGTIVKETPFIEGFEIVVKGKSSHSSVPKEGINALSIAGHAISNFKWGNIGNCSTANIGLIEGGSAVNVTPGEILLKGEIRSADKKEMKKIEEELEKVFSKSARLYKGKIKIEYQYYCDGYMHENNEISIKLIEKIYKNRKIKRKFVKSLGASDANFFNKKGIKVIDIGDGVKNPHTFEESISLFDLNRLTDIFTNYISL